MRTEPKSAKKTYGLTVFFALLGSVCSKVVLRMLMKLTPGVDFTNILRVAFMSTDPKSANKTDSLTAFLCFLESACIKATLKMLVKLTPEVNFTNL